MPFDAKRYPANWREISLRIRERDGWCCKWCGVKNGAWVLRDDERIVQQWTHGEVSKRDGVVHVWDEDADGTPTSEEQEFWLSEPHPIKIVLTVAHHPDSDPMNCTDDNLHALCQRCHNRLDAPMRAVHALATRRAQKLAAGQMEIDL